MKIEISSRPVFSLPLPLKTVELLMTMSRHHYDGRCKSASAVGGFIYGWSNSVTFAPEGPVDATWDQLDTLLKICENVAVLHEDPGARSVVWKLTTDVHRALSHWNRISKDWCTVIDTETMP